MSEPMRGLGEILDDIAKEAMASGDQRILDLVEEASEWYDVMCPQDSEAEMYD